MREKFEEQLELLNRELTRMGNLIQERIQSSIEALVRQDIERAKEIMAQDEEIDHMQKKIEDICFHLLVQQQPVAKDLRAVTAAMKMVTDMERIGDHAADISEMTIMLSGKIRIDSMETINKMAGEALIMLIPRVAAFVERNLEKAYKVIEHDDVVDRLFETAKKELIELIQKNPQDGEQELDLLMIAKYLERIGDHATNLAEWVIFSLDDRRE